MCLLQLFQVWPSQGFPVNTHSRPQCLVFLCFSVYGMQQQCLTGIQLPTVKWLFISNHPTSTQHHVHFWQQINVSWSRAEIRVCSLQLYDNTLQISEHYEVIQPKQLHSNVQNPLWTCCIYLATYLKNSSTKATCKKALRTP